MSEVAQNPRHPQSFGWISESLSTLKEKQKDTLRVVVYCRTLMICADLFSCFSYEMGTSQPTLLVHLN